MDSLFILAFRPWVSNRTAQSILIYVHFSSPLILLAFFLTAFTAHSIATASNDAVVSADPEQTGPGGKPLPQTSVKGKKPENTLDFSPARKLLFNWLSVGISVSFVGNAVVVILHTLLDRGENWWCGEATAVCLTATNRTGREADSMA